ncbi:Periplasmic binding protein [Lachnospiraceae bacterium TWA4]|nr:Periplasmic binding protein [Lachnospiraceae bacterium TWA4]
MKRKQVLTLVLTSAMAVSMLAGCGSNANDSSKTTTAASTTQAGTTAAKADSTTESASKDYTPVTITMNLDRSGMGTNQDITIEKKPTHVVADGGQMAAMFYDLGLKDVMAGYVHGACVDNTIKYEGWESVPQLVEAGTNLKDVSKETVLATGCDFLVGWDSLYGDQNYSIDFCNKNGIIPYFPYVCSDSATFDDLYKDYETLGKIFQVEDTATKKVETMKNTLSEVEEKLGKEAYEKPIKVFVYDSGEDAPFTACQGIPGETLKKAGAISIFSDIEKGWATPSWEEVVQRDPDAILILDYNGETDEKKKFLETNTHTKGLRAVKEGKIYSASCAVMQGSAKSAELVKEIAQDLYPDKMK